MRRVVPNPVAVLFTAGGKAGVKALGRPGCREHPDVLRQPRVEGENELPGSEPPQHPRHIKVGAHSGRMNPGIGPAGSGNPRPAGKQLREGFFDPLLDRKIGRLTLPSGIRRPIERNNQAKAHVIRRQNLLRPGV